MSDKISTRRSILGALACAPGAPHMIGHFSVQAPFPPMRGREPGRRGSETSALEAKHEMIDVHDFGAMGDGVTDDSAALQAALDTLRPGASRSLSFPPGKYCISRQLVVPVAITSIQLYGSTGYDGVRGPINSGLATSLQWIGPHAPSTAMVKFDQGSGIRWTGISLDCSYKAGYGLQFMSSDRATGSVKNIVENCSIHYATRDGIIVGEWGPTAADPGDRQFFGNVFRNLTFFGCRFSAIHINEWNADQQMFDTVMVYHDDGPSPQLSDNAFWFDHGGQWSTLINCQAGGMTVDPGTPSSGYMIRNQANDSTTGGGFGLTVINAWQEGAGGLYYGVTSTNDNKGFTFMGCASFTSNPNIPSIFIDKGTFERISYTFIGCSLMSDIKIATPAVAKRDVVLVNCSFASGKGLTDASNHRVIEGNFTQKVVTDGVLVVPCFADALFCTLTGAVRVVHAESAATIGDRITIVVTQDAVGGRTIHWAASGNFSTRPAIPQPNSGPLSKTAYSFVSDGLAYVLISNPAGGQE